MSKHLKIAAAALIVLGIATRIAVVCVSGPSPHFNENINTDEVNYLELASNITDYKRYGAWSEGFYTQSTRSPGYPALLSFSTSSTMGRNGCLQRSIWSWIR